MIGVLLTAAAMAVATKFRVIQVSVPLDSPLLAAAAQHQQRQQEAQDEEGVEGRDSNPSSEISTE